jgi:hypothetical protein
MEISGIFVEFIWNYRWHCARPCAILYISKKVLSAPQGPRLWATAACGVAQDFSGKLYSAVGLSMFEVIQPYKEKTNVY